MVVLIQSQTVPINPPGVQPVLTVAQFWNVLKTKSRKPQLFIKQIASATILKESDFGLTREASLKDGMIGPPSGKFVEDVYFKKPWKV